MKSGEKRINKLEPRSISRLRVKQLLVDGSGVKSDHGPVKLIAAWMRSPWPEKKLKKATSFKQQAGLTGPEG